MNVILCLYNDKNSVMQIKKKKVNIGLNRISNKTNIISLYSLVISNDI